MHYCIDGESHYSAYIEVQVGSCAAGSVWSRLCGDCQSAVHSQADFGELSKAGGERQADRRVSQCTLYRFNSDTAKLWVN